jgi:hypothetical protein
LRICWIDTQSVGLIQGSAPKRLIADARQLKRELLYVYRIVDYLCRYDRHIGDNANFNIESGKTFVQKMEPEDDETYGPSKISKIWETYKNAAPYIFAFYRFLSSGLQKAITPDNVIDWIDKFTSDQKRLTRLIGRAAYAADILVGKARNVRQRDFKNIDRIAPPMPPFTYDEMVIINSIDRHAPIA